MIFDPSLAAAAARHARAAKKSNSNASATGEAPLTENGDTGGRAQSIGGEVGGPPLPDHPSGDTDKAATASDRDSLGSTSLVEGHFSVKQNGDGDGRVWANSLGRTGVEAARGGQGGRKMKPRVLVKIVVLGCSNVGKTSLMKRYAANDFSEKRSPTIGADFMTKEFVAGDQPMLLQVWDTAGQERFQGGSLGSGFFRGANAALLVYDVACATSFEQVAMWREELLVRLDVDPHDFPIVVIGNKVDLAVGLPMDGVQGVDKSKVLKWCEMQGVGHIETSAKDGSGVEVAMQAVAMLALDQKRRRDKELELNPALARSTTLSLANERVRQQKSRNCC